MKHKYLTLIILTSLAATAAAQAPFQLPNPGFEQWDGGYDSEPTHWNTFESCIRYIKECFWKNDFLQFIASEKCFRANANHFFRFILRGDSNR